MEYYIGVDVGTTGTKCVLFDGAGAELAAAYEPYPLSSAPGGVAEQDAEDWYRSLCAAVRCCVNACPGAKVCAMALSTQGGSVAAVKHGRAIRPAVTWMDTRNGALAKSLEETPPFSKVYEKTGWPPTGMTLFYPFWLKKHDVEALNADLFLTTAEYLAMRLTGRAVTDHTNAAMTQVFNINSLEWDGELLAACGLDISQLPESVAPGTLLGALTHEAAAELSLSPETLLYAGAHDQYCAALGSGTAEDGSALLSAGTTWVLLVSGTVPFFDPGRCFKPGRQAVPGLWGAMGSMVTGAVCLERARELLGGADFAVIDKMAAGVPPGSRGAVFYPYLSGSYVPGTELDNRGVISGLSLGTGEPELYRAVMEGVTFELARMMRYYEKNRAGIDVITLAGGAAKSALWTQMIADITGREIRLAGENAACRGAFMLAAKKTPHILQERAVFPDPLNAAAYKALLEAYEKNFTHVCELNGVGK